ncbi:MAG: FAD binding domain-containing protein [Saccharofermentans sp.]|nr:FAD binding domain-containing protein [Saccharofermentans sp.]
MISIQKYEKVQSLEQAFELNQGKKNRIIGGMMWLNMGHTKVNTAIDISGLGLNTIEETDEEFIIGAMVTLRQLEQHESLNSFTSDSVKNAVKDIVGVQFRNMATIGGSLWGRFGFSDLLTVFLAMDSYVELYPTGIVSLKEFSEMKRDNSILVNLIVKKTPIKICYSAMRAQRTDFPVLACATSFVNGEYRAVIGARPAKAKVVLDNEGILDSGITEETATKFAEYVAANIVTGSNNRGGAKYRKHLALVLTMRNIMKLGGDRND